MHLNILVFFAFILLGCVYLGLILWWGNYQEGKKSEDREEHIYVIRGTKQQHELLKQVAEKENISIQKITSITF